MMPAPLPVAIIGAGNIGKTHGRVYKANTLAELVAICDIDRAKALALMAAHPSLIKRPVVEHPGGLLVGFVEGDWKAAL